MNKSLLAGVALAILTAASASAADLARAPITKAPPVPYASPVFSWSGGYIGVAGGYAWNNDFKADAVGGGLLGFAPGAINTGLSPNGGFFGGTLGYNWQIPGSMFVLGIEGDAFLSDINDSKTIVAFGPASIGATSKLDKFGTVRGRVGVAYDRSLFFATGGVAIGYNEATVDFNLAPIGARLFDSQTHVGWTVGGGWEYAFANSWTAKAEYRYVDFESKTYNFLGSPAVGSGVDIDPSFHQVLFGLNYKLGY
jgi:outer membrane immunogenic protein